MLRSLKFGISCLSQVLREGDDVPLGCAVAVVDENTTVNLVLRNVVDAEKEIERLQKKRVDLMR